MSNYKYAIKKLNTKSWIKYWLWRNRTGGTKYKFSLSEILENTSYNLQNTINRKFNIFEILGNSIQNGEPSPENEVPILSAGADETINFNIININFLPSNGNERIEQNYIIPTQQPMRSIGDVRDLFVKENGNWIERHLINRKIFDGTENILYTDAGNWNFRFLPTPEMINSSSSNYNYVRCNLFKGKVAGYDEAVTSYLKYICFRYDLYKNGSSTDFKNWLAQKYANNNPLYVDYLLAEPLDLPCTEEQIEILNNIEENAKTYNEETNIISTDEVPAILKIQYWERVER